MMFRGTYTSPFYRAVRDLLHDEVRLGASAQRSLQRRWDRLLGRHESFLNLTPRPAATLASPAAGFP
jgi:hypothetical protein